MWSNRLGWVLLGVLVLRLVLAGTTGIVEDEAYYWTWSERLDWGYYDHPPGVAYVIGLSVAVLGKTSLGLRALGVVLGVSLPLLLARFTPRPGLLLLLLAGMPLFTLGGVLVTPDIPLIFGWTLAVAGALRGGWGLAGLGVGIASLGKYTGWGIWPLLILAEVHDAWVNRRKVPVLEIGMGLVVTGLIIAPNLLWNLDHSWVSVKFQLNHGLGNQKPPGLGGALEFLGAQAGLVSPVLFLVMGAWFLQRPQTRVDRFCWWTSVPVVVFFAYAATRSHGEANWAAGAWVGAALGVSRAGGRFERAAWVSGFLAMFLSLLVVVHLYVPLFDLPKDPTARLGIGKELADSVAAWGIEPVYTSRYQEAALLQWYRGIEAYALPGVDRLDQYDLWPIRWSDRALFVRPYKSGDKTVADPFCTRGAPNVVTQNNVDGSLFSRWQVYEVFECGRRGHHE